MGLGDIDQLLCAHQARHAGDNAHRQFGAFAVIAPQHGNVMITQRNRVDRHRRNRGNQSF